MKEFVAVNDAFTLIAWDSEIAIPSCLCLKREALMFSRIAIPFIREGIFSNNESFNEYPDFIKELEWLLENGLVFEPKLEGKAHHSSEEYNQVLNSVRSHAMEIISAFIGFNIQEVFEAKGNKEKTKAVQKKLDRMLRRTHEDIKAAIENDGFIQTAVKMIGCMTRMFSVELREGEGMDAYPILSDIALDVQMARRNKDEVIEIVINALPVPDDTTPWEQIIEFRNDPDSQNKFLPLKNWINEVARMKLAAYEVEDKLEALISDYTNHLKIHKIKIRMDTLKTIVLAEAGLITSGWLTGLGALPGVIGMVVTPLYSIKQSQIALLEEEQKAPGKEIAYIIKARESFSE